MDRKKIIEEYLFEGSLEERKERFEIAWDVWKNFDRIKLSIREGVLGKLRDKIRKKTQNPNDPFYGYKLDDSGFLKRQKWGNMVLYKQEWIVDGKPILMYGIEYEKENYVGLYLGISKYSNQIPLVGNWEDAQGLLQEWKEIFEQVKIRLKEALPGNWKPSDWWILWKYFDSYYGGMWQKEFYIEILENSKNNLEEGCEALADYYIDKLEKLRDATEELIDEFVKLYKYVSKSSP